MNTLIYIMGVAGSGKILHLNSQKDLITLVLKKYCAVTRMEMDK